MSTNVNRYLLMYICIINIVGYFIILIDKYKAKRDKWRIKESTMLIVGLIGGALGNVLSMTMFRHKTQHKKFYIGMPIVAILHLVILIYLLWIYIV